MRVLLLGDSYTYGPYGDSLKALFEAAGHDVTRVGIAGVSASTYLNGKWRTLPAKGDYNAAKTKSYDLAIVSLGTNDAALFVKSAAGAQRVASDMKTLTDGITAKRIVWVGAPAFNDLAAKHYNSKQGRVPNLNARASLVWDAVAPIYGANSIDPRDATRPWTKNLGIEIHFGAKGGAAWARYVFDKVMTGAETVETPSESEGPLAPPTPSSIHPLLLAAIAFIAFKALTGGKRGRLAY